MEEYKARTGVSGVTNMSDRERLFRYDVIFSLLGSGDPLASIDAHRPSLQKHAYKITDATHLSDLIPLLLDDEMKRIQKEMGTRKMHIVFDGASYNGECFLSSVFWWGGRFSSALSISSCCQSHW